MFTGRLCGGSVVTSRPCTSMPPSVGSTSPAIIRSVVVLPQPLGPMSEKNSPSAISRSTPVDGGDVAVEPCAGRAVRSRVAHSAALRPSAEHAAGARRAQQRDEAGDEERRGA